MTFQTGSTADYEALAKAVEVSERMERSADLMGDAATYKLADQAYLRIFPAALRCGYSWSNPDTVLVWAKRRLAVLSDQYRKAA